MMMFHLIYVCFIIFLFKNISDTDASGDDDADVPGRNAIKKASQFIVDSKTKRRTTKKKKKTK